MAGKRTILIVDDSPTVRMQISDLLSGAFDCVTAVDGNDGFNKAIRAPSPDAILADLEMPGMDGIELLKALKNDPRTSKIPVVIATTVTAIEKVNECRALGCAGFVLKPLKKDYLLAKLTQLTTK
jgi:CheY-like chemotaxis protein